MTLTAEQREKAWNRFRKYMEESGPTSFDKNVLRTNLDSAISWTEIGAVRSSFNDQLSEPFKSSATVRQKMVLLAFALLYEAGIFV